MLAAPSPNPDARLGLPTVTLCAVTSRNVPATVRALEVCLAQIDFATCKLFTDAPVQVAHPGITIVPIQPLMSSAAYSNFLLTHLVDHIDTPYCMVAQWDGHVIDARRWRPEFLDYDYIGASWPQFDDGHDVGNGGFSLRSKRLMLACRDPQFRPGHPEDIAIGRTNRDWLESTDMRFAPKALADLFATERAGRIDTSFGYHGVFNMPQAIGPDTFWDIYRELDDRGNVRHDFGQIAKSLRRGSSSWPRVAMMLADRLKHALQNGKWR